MTPLIAGGSVASSWSQTWQAPRAGLKSPTAKKNVTLDSCSPKPPSGYHGCCYRAGTQVGLLKILYVSRTL
jgi:hypothetical protein